MLLLLLLQLITFLVILTCSFQAAILIFPLICTAAHTYSHANSISGMLTHIWPYYMLTTSLVIPTYSFEMAAIWYFSWVCCQ